MPVCHPSRYIREELVARRWTRNQFALQIGGSFGINRLALDFYFMIGPRNPDMRMGEMAATMAAALGVSEDFLLNLERAWLAETPSVN